MLKYLLWSLLGIVVGLFIYAGYTLSTTRTHSPEGVSKLTSNATTIKVDYCRPYKKGREIFGELVPFGEYWRTGANEPTRINFSTNVKFGGERVKAGTYRLYTIPGEDNWTVALNSELENWGYYEPDYSLDVVRVKAPVIETKKEIEQFIIELLKEGDNIKLRFAWDDTQVEVPIELE
ncbi:DUF2911 domain-containing protein [Reichenbachiella versicolor]|uniref:DUF2911 domain-containing protein n=1 Tax=Reichenbachiella versicolor TaxID=1821036 RepID=UPI000D6DE25F|nr:DUF2911 domain-containing protein [Reichenbachiella versicolor]